MAAESRNLYLYMSYIALNRKFCSSVKTVCCVLVMSATQRDDSP
jgi:hypothetical protein